MVEVRGRFFLSLRYYESWSNNWKCRRCFVQDCPTPNLLAKKSISPENVDLAACLKNFLSEVKKLRQNKDSSLTQENLESLMIIAIKISQTTVLKRTCVMKSLAPICFKTFIFQVDQILFRTETKKLSVQP
jgi:hypothetical protein